MGAVSAGDQLCGVPGGLHVRVLLLGQGRQDPVPARPQELQAAQVGGWVAHYRNPLLGL